MESKKNTYLFSNIILTFLPILIAIVIPYAVAICDVLGLLIKNVFSSNRANANVSAEALLSQAYNQPMNQALLLILQYGAYILIFGIWYYRAFIKPDKAAPNFKRVFLSLSPVFLLITGFAMQTLVDSVLVLVRPHFESAFSAYDKMLSNIIGVTASPLSLIAVFLLAPIGEELLFRGIVMGCSKRYMTPVLAILLQAFLFGAYHGNVIQFVYAFALGLIFGFIDYKFNSILPGIILHSATNISILFIPEMLFRTTQLCFITGGISIVIIGVFTFLAIRFRR